MSFLKETMTASSFDSLFGEGRKQRNVWGTITTREGEFYSVDDWRYVKKGGFVEFITAHDHRRVTVPVENISRIKEGCPDGRERIFEKGGNNHNPYAVSRMEKYGGY